MTAAVTWAIFHAMNTQWSKSKIRDEPENVGVGRPGMPISISEMDPVIT